MSDDRVSLWASARHLAADVAGHRPRLLALVVLLLLARGATEGLSYLVLVPLLGMADTTAISGSAIGGTLAPGWLRLATFGYAPSVGTALAVFLALMLARAVLTYASARASATFNTGFVETLRQRLYVVLTRARWSYLAGTRQSADARAVTSDCDLAGAATFVIVNLIAATASVIGGMIAAFALSPRLTLAVLLACGLAALPMLVFQRWAYARAARVMQTMLGLYEVMQSRVGGLKLAKAFAIEREMEAEFAAASTAHRDSVVAVHENTARAALVQEAAASLLLAVVVGLGSLFYDVTGGELVALIIIFARIAPLMLGMQTNLRGLVATLPSYDALKARITEAQAHAEALPDTHAPLTLTRSIVLDRVSYAHPGTDGPSVIAGLSLTLAAGTVTGLVGASGAGKSTVADLIAGLIAPTDGRVLVDDEPLDAPTRMRWRASVAYIPQDAPLFHASLRDNLRLGARSATDDEIWACLDIVGASDLVRRMPDGLATMAGDSGVRLSGGERQRIRLASALLRRPQMLILDESTSALSPADEATVIAALRLWHARPTMLVIAHRASSVAWTDRIVLLSGGRVAADGRPPEILEAHFNGATPI